MLSRVLDHSLVFTFVAFVICAFALTEAQEVDDKVVVCYYASWSAYKPDDGHFVIEDINTNLCTHIIYAFASLNETNNVIVPSDPSLDIDQGGYSKFVGLKERNPDLKALLSIGGWNDGSRKYSDMASAEASRRTFVHSVVEFLQGHQFDGLDFDWEFPTARGGRIEDKDNFAHLISELRQAFNEYDLILTAAVSPNEDYLNNAYNFTTLCRDLDIINLMMYDLYGYWDNITGHHTSLFTDPKLGEIANSLNQSMAAYHSVGGCPRKTAMGMGAYGRTYTLEDSTNTDTGSPTTGPGVGGPYSGEEGYMGYNEICLLSGYTEDHDVYTEAPWAYNDDQWVAFDNVHSIERKCEFALTHNLAGAMIWSLDTDDFRGSCGEVTYPLLREINRMMRPTPATFTP